MSLGRVTEKIRENKFPREITVAWRWQPSHRIALTFLYRMVRFLCLSVAYLSCFCLFRRFSVVMSAAQHGGRAAPKGYATRKGKERGLLRG